MNYISDQLQEVKKHIPPHVTLVAISKTKPNHDILEAYHAGQKVFGENKVQELVDKFETLPKDIEWHLVGHLQTNKVKYIAPFVGLIHSVDSKKLMDEIDKQGNRINRKIPILLQIYIAKEETKFGLDESELHEICALIGQYQNIEWRGLMGMATNTNDMSVVRNEFKVLKYMFDQVKKEYFFNHDSFKEISMGMSSDYLIAIEEGSTMVRIGSTIFGQRNNL